MRASIHLRLLLAALLIATAVFARPRQRRVITPPGPAIVDAVADVFRPLPLDQQKLGGVIGARLRANSEGYIEHVADGQQDGPPGQIGKLLDAAVFTFEYNRHARSNAVMVRLARKLTGSQAPDGYIGARSNPDQWTEQDTWAQGADLSGLVNYYRITGDQTALAASTRLAALLLKERSKRSGDETAIFAGALAPMLELYRYTDENKYLDFCNTVAEAWLHNKPPELPVTYKNLGVLNALVELYRTNGDNSVYAAPLRAWTEMHASGFDLTGVPVDTSSNNPEPLNACTTGSWLKLSTNLLRISGQAAYSEQIERTVYNQLFAGQDARTGAIFASVGWSGKKEPANGSPCAPDEALALAQLPGVVWGRYGHGLAINLYTYGRTTVRLRRRGTVQLYMEANYPESGTVLLHIEPDHPIHFPLRLRVPDWTTKFTADAGQDHLIGKPGDFLTVNRAWKRGDTVKIAMTMNARAIPGLREYSADIAVARGPQLLALCKTVNPGITDFDRVTVDRPDPAGLQLAPLESTDAETWPGGTQAYTLMGTYQDQPKKLVFVPFADALNYRVWLAQSKTSSGASAR